MFRQKLFKLAFFFFFFFLLLLLLLFFPLLAFCRQTNGIFTNVKSQFCLISVSDVLQYLWRFINSFLDFFFFFMFYFESDPSAFHFIDVWHFGNTRRNSMHIAERVIHLRLKQRTIEWGPDKVETIDSTGTCNCKRNYIYFLYWGNVFLSDVTKMSHDMTKPTKWVCAQWRLRSAWASAQSDQSLRCALNG